MTTLKFQVGDHVLYGKTGLCRIDDIAQLSFSHLEEKQFYILHPLSDPNSQIFVPCDSECLVSKMHHLMSREEIHEILISSRGNMLCWVEDKHERNAAFQKILSGGDRKELLMMISCIYQKKQERIANGKRLWISDENMLRIAEKMIEEEFSFTLGIPSAQIGSYIKARLEEST